MSLMNSLMRYKQDGLLNSFDMYDDKRTKIYLRNGTSIIVYMAEKYIIGTAEVEEAAEAPRADYLVYNVWDTIGRDARTLAARYGIKVQSFGAFADELGRLHAT